MRKIFRVIYPFLIYMAVCELLMLAASYIMTTFYIMSHGGMDFNTAYSYVIEIIYAQGIYWTAASAAIASLILALFYRRDCVMRSVTQGLVLPGSSRIKGIGYVVLLGAAACVAGNNFITLIRLDVFFPSYGEVAESLFIGSLPVQLLCVGVLVPIAEEMVFRVLGFRRLRDHMNFLPAALITAILFGFYHGNMVQGVYAFMLGFVIAYAYELYDRPVVPITIHISANVFSMIFMVLPVFGGAYGIVVMVVGTVAAVMIGRECLKKIRFYGLTNE